MENRLNGIPNVLTVAGTDPSGGAGIQADLKTFSALGVYGMSVVTALVAQNTQGVGRILDVPGDFAAAQIESLFADVRVDAVKIGMVNTADTASVIADALRRFKPKLVVLDPVMAAKSGDALLMPDAVAVVRDELVPLATVITPNLPEAGMLVGGAAPRTVEEMRGALGALYGLGPEWVLLKGGHLEGEASVDLLFDGESVTEMAAERVETDNTHGTGCTLSAALTALAAHNFAAASDSASDSAGGKAQGARMVEAAQGAKDYLTGALRCAGRLDVGRGHGPVHHFYRLWEGGARPP